MNEGEERCYTARAKPMSLESITTRLPYLTPLHADLFERALCWGEPHKTMFLVPYIKAWHKAPLYSTSQRSLPTAETLRKDSVSWWWMGMSGGFHTRVWQCTVIQCMQRNCGFPLGIWAHAKRKCFLWSLMSRIYVSANASAYNHWLVVLRTSANYGLWELSPHAASSQKGTECR